MKQRAPTDLAQPQIHAILAHFCLPESSGIRLLGGWANRNYLISTEEGQQYVVKRLLLQKPELLPNDLAIQQQLAAAGMTAPLYEIDTHGSCLYDHDGVCAVVSRLLSGAHPQRLSNDFCYEIGKTLAAFHGAVHHLPKPSRGWLNPQAAVRAAEMHLDAPDAEAARALIKANTFIFASGHPVGIIHGDLHEENVLIASETQPAIVAVLDFEEAEQNLYLVDLARTILSVCRDLTGRTLLHDRVTACELGYSSLRPLGEAEHRELGAAICYVIGVEVIWLHEHGFGEEAQIHIARAANVPFETP